MQSAHAVMVDYFDDFRFFNAFNGLSAFIMVNKNKLGFVGFQQADFVNHANVSCQCSGRLPQPGRSGNWYRAWHF